MHLEIFAAVTEGQTSAALCPLRPLFYLKTKNKKARMQKVVRGCRGREGRLFTREEIKSSFKM